MNDELQEAIRDVRGIGEGLPDPSELSEKHARMMAKDIGNDEDLRIFLRAENGGKARESVLDAIKARRWDLRESTYAVIDHEKHRFATDGDGVFEKQIWREQDSGWAWELARDNSEYEVVEVVPSEGSPPDEYPSERIAREMGDLFGDNQ